MEDSLRRVFDDIAEENPPVSRIDLAGAIDSGRRIVRRRRTTGIVTACGAAVAVVAVAMMINLWVPGSPSPHGVAQSHPAPSPSPATATPSPSAPTTTPTTPRTTTRPSNPSRTPVRIEAENADVISGLKVLDGSALSASGNSYMGWSEDGHYLAFRKVNLTGVHRLHLRIATPLTDSRFEIRVGGPTGTLVSTVTLPATGGWAATGRWRTVVADVDTTVSGRQEVYVVFRNSVTHGVADLDWIQLS